MSRHGETVVRFTVGVSTQACCWPCGNVRAARVNTPLRAARPIPISLRISICTHVHPPIGADGIRTMARLPFFDQSVPVAGYALDLAAPIMRRNDFLCISGRGINFAHLTP